MDLPALTSPEHLGWLLLLPVLYWLSRPRRPRRIVATPHLAQWLRAQARLRRKPIRFRWLRFVLLAIAFGGSVIALAGPTSGGREGPRSLIVLVDASASMAQEGRPWDRARDLVAARLRALPAHIDVRLAVCGPAPRVVAGEVAELLAALPAEPRGAGGVDLQALAAGMAARENSAVWTITDGLGPTPPPREGALTVLGAPAANIAITGLVVEDRWPLPEIALEVEIRSFGAEPSELRISAAGGVDPVEPVPVTLGSDAVERVALVLRRAAGGRVRISLDGHRDALAVDDAVEFDLPPPAAPDIRVLCDGEVPPALQAAAAALAAETQGRVVAAEEGERVGFLIADGGILQQRGGTMRFLTFGTRFDDAPLAPDDLVADPAIVDWDRTDPITQGLDLSDLAIERCLRNRFLGSGSVLVRAEHGPVLVVDEGEQWSSVHASFRLADSNFGQLPAFPQFLRRCFARSFRDKARPTLSPENLLSAAESDLRRAAAASDHADRPLPAFGWPSSSLAVPLLLAALAALAARLYA